MVASSTCWRSGPVVAAVAEAHQVRRLVGATERDRGQVVGQAGQVQAERAHGGHHQVLPDGVQVRVQRVQRARQPVVVALRRLEPPQVGQRRPRQPGLDVHQRLRRQQAVEHQHAGDQPHVEVARACSRPGGSAGSPPPAAPGAPAAAAAGAAPPAAGSARGPGRLPPRGLAETRRPLRRQAGRRGSGRGGWGIARAPPRLPRPGGPDGDPRPHAPHCGTPHHRAKSRLSHRHCGEPG